MATLTVGDTRKNYYRQRFKTVTERFFEKVSLVGDCWIWDGAMSKSGYGLFWNGDKYESAHRYSYRRYNGPINKSQMVRHSCDTPACVNPAHLSTGTAWDNEQDKIERGRQANGEKNAAAKLTEKDVRRIRTDKRGPVELANAYGVNYMTIYRIRSRKTWRHI